MLVPQLAKLVTMTKDLLKVVQPLADRVDGPAAKAISDAVAAVGAEFASSPILRGHSSGVQVVRHGDAAIGSGVAPGLAGPVREQLDRIGAMVGHDPSAMVPPTRPPPPAGPPVGAAYAPHVPRPGYGPR